MEFSVEKESRFRRIVHPAGSVLRFQPDEHHGRFRFSAQGPGYLLTDEGAGKFFRQKRQRDDLAQRWFVAGFGKMVWPPIFFG